MAKKKKNDKKYRSQRTTQKLKLEQHEINKGFFWGVVELPALRIFLHFLSILERLNMLLQFLNHNLITFYSLRYHL